MLGNQSGTLLKFINVIGCITYLKKNRIGINPISVLFQYPIPLYAVTVMVLTFLLLHDIFQKILVIRPSSIFTSPKVYKKK